MIAGIRLKSQQFAIRFTLPSNLNNVFTIKLHMLPRKLHDSVLPITLHVILPQTISIFKQRVKSNLTESFVWTTNKLIYRITQTIYLCDCQVFLACSWRVSVAVLLDLLDVSLFFSCLSQMHAPEKESNDTDSKILLPSCNCHGRS